MLLGQRVDAYGMTTAQEKLEAIRGISLPKSLRALEVYLGLTGWLRQYIEHYAFKAELLQRRKTALLQSAPVSGHARKHYARITLFEPTAEEVDAFNTLQADFAEPSFLAHFQSNRKLYIDLDASKEKGIGAMVYHVKGDPTASDNIKRGKIEPILFLSRMLSAAESRYWPTELEVAGLVWTIKKVCYIVASTT